MKTEYRIIPYRTFIADKYLQFKSVKTVTKRRISNLFRKTTETIEIWRFVPKENCPIVLGYYLYEDYCPTEMPFMSSGDFLSCFNEQEWDLKRFAKQYPDISVYFQELHDKRKKYLEKEKRANNAKVEYL